MQASFVVSGNIAMKMKSYSEGEFFKDVMLSVVDILCPEFFFSQISLSK